MSLEIDGALKLIYCIYKIYRFRYLSPSSGFLVLKCSSFLGDGDVERGVVFGGSVGVVLGSVVLNLASRSRRLDDGHWYGHQWCRWCRLDDGCHVGGAAAASPQEVAYTE